MWSTNYRLKQRSRVVVRFRSVASSRKVGSMKKQILWTPLILIAILAIAAVSTRAQAVYGARADVPFDFIVGDKTIAAGRISANGVSDAVFGSLVITNKAQGELAVRTGRRLLGAERSNQCKLVFHRYGDRYFLAEIWIPGYQAWEVTKSKEEKSLERGMRLTKNFKPSRIVVAATTD